MIFGIKIIINYLTLKNNLSVDNECKCQMLSLLYPILLRMGRYRKDPIPPVQNLCRRKGEGVKKTLDLLWLFQDIRRRGWTPFPPWGEVWIFSGMAQCKVVYLAVLLASSGGT